MKICTDINFDDFSSFEEVADQLDCQYTTISQDCSTELPCYLIHLEGTEQVNAALIPGILEAVCHFAPDDGIVLFSVNSLERNYKEWLEAVEDYPGVHIRTVSRGGYKCYLVTFPVTPKMDEA